jgi:tetratricopeptide (TPR) repeat protein
MPGQTDADYRRAIALSGLGRHQEALSAADEFLRRFPGNTDALLLRGAELSELGRPEDALQAFDEIVSGDPGHAVAHHNRAVLLTKAGRRDEALDAYDQSIASAPEQIYFRIGKGKALTAAGELDRARDEFDAASRLRPQEAAEADTWAAAILWHQGDPQAARERFTQAKQHLTGGPSAKNTTLEAITLCALDNASAAEQALRQGPGTPSGEDFDRLCELLSDPPLPGIDRLRSARA